MRFFFCKAQTTLCVHSRKNRRGTIKQNRLNKQNGAGRLFTAPEPSAPSGRCSEAEAGPETERCAAGKSPRCSATISGLGMVVGSSRAGGAASGRAALCSKRPALAGTFLTPLRLPSFSPQNPAGQPFAGAPSIAHRITGALFLLQNTQRPCAFTTARTGGVRLFPEIGQLKQSKWPLRKNALS